MGEVDNRKCREPVGEEIMNQFSVRRIVRRIMKVKNQLQGLKDFFFCLPIPKYHSKVASVFRCSHLSFCQ